MVRVSLLLCSALLAGCGVEPDSEAPRGDDSRVQVDECTTPDNADVLQYMELDECTAALIGCDAGGEYYEDECGCGCLVEDAPVCTTPDNADVLQYMELEDCVASLVGCDAGGEYYEDECGCGCLLD